MDINKKIRLSENQQLELKEKINNFFELEYDIQLGEIGYSVALEFILNEVGPVIYNTGVRDAKDYMQTSLEDLYALEIKDRRD